METIIKLSFGTSLVTIFYSIYLIRNILSFDAGDKKMLEISEAISEGAGAYLKRQYKTVFIVAAFLLVLLWLSLGLPSALGFALGALASACTGFVGMNVAVRSNSRTTQAAKHGLSQALSVAFKGGAVTGLLVASLALFSISLTLALSKIYSFDPILPLVSLGFGGSLISVFARLGGGIYTKGADVGTDMVGKIEKGIPEDDPRNPGVIADLVGDNVGDDAGMAADLFETYAITAVAAMILGNLTFPSINQVLLYPLLLGAVAIVASIIGVSVVRIRGTQIMAALYQGLAVTALLALIGFYFTTQALFPNGLMNIPQLNIFYSCVIGIVVTMGMVVITEYFTSKNYSPVKTIANASTTGHGTNVIAGLAISMKSTFAPIILISAAIFFAYNFAGLYGVAVAAMSMLSLTGIIVAIDAFGPITDNAGGIAEMTNIPAKVRNITGSLDAVGNTTKAVTKGYAIASAGLAALVLFSSFTQEFASAGVRLNFTLEDPLLIAGLFLGGLLPYYFGALCLEAVGKTAGK